MPTHPTTKPYCSDPDREPRPRVPAGATLTFSSELERAGRWPAVDCGRRPPKPREDCERPVATAYLVVPFGPGDLGGRPVADTRVQHSAAVVVRDAGGVAVAQPQAGVTYSLEAHVDNRGVAAAYFGLAAFYVAPPADVEAAAGGGAPLVARGHAGFSVNPAASTIVRCNRPWSPASDEEARASIVVHAYDPTIDPLGAPFDAHANRHVGRRDPIANFAGVWNGLVTTSWGNGEFVQRLVIAQSGSDVTVQFFDQLGGGLPATPQMTGSGTIAGEQATGFVTSQLGGQPFTTNAWTLTMTGPDALQFHNQREFVAPGDTRGTQIITGTHTR